MTPVVIHAWIVRTSHLPERWPLEHGKVAINCHVRADVADLPLSDIDALRSASRLQYARELDRFTHAVDIRDAVLAVHIRSKVLLVGHFVGPYEYRPELRPEQPHMRAVRWQKQVHRDDLPDPGVALPSLGAVYAFGQVAAAHAG